MKLSEKILYLRKKHGLSQEDLAGKLNVSRQAISRWEVGSAQPEASNVLQLSKLFGVTTDYLLYDEYEGDGSIPTVRNTEVSGKRSVRKRVGLCAALSGLLGNFVIYILSRCIEVELPLVHYENGKKWYHWNVGLTGHSYPYFIRAYDLELLSALFWGLFLVGGLYLLASSNALQTLRNRSRAKG